MKTIPLTKGYEATVDDNDFINLMRYKWKASITKGTVYAVRNAWIKDEKRYRNVYMHREILRLRHGDKKIVDHINHDTTDNRKINLRLCTHSQNLMNMKSNTGSSAFKGVFWNKQAKKWHAIINVEKKSKHLGYYKIEAEAALAYDTAARIHFGEYAHLNF